MSTLTDFLLARIAEDECWLTAPTAKRMIGRRVVTVPIQRPPQYVQADRQRWEVECAAKRRIVEEHPVTHSDVWDTWHCDRCSDENTDWDRDEGGCQTLRALASIYSDHPDYREDWR